MAIKLYSVSQKSHISRFGQARAYSLISRYYHIITISMKASQPHQKIPYLSCPIKEHEGEALNLVCISCDNPGLLCSLCSENHRNHRKVPLKILLLNLKNQLTQAPDDENYCSHMQLLEHTKNILLFELKCTVEQIAGQFQKLEQSIVDTYNELKMKIIDQIQLGLEIDGLVDNVIAGNVSTIAFADSIQKLARYVQPRDQHFVLSIDFDTILRPYRELERVLPERLRAIQDYVAQKLLQKSNFPSASGKDFIEVVSQQVPQIPISANQYRFSSTLKGSTIALNEKRTIARQEQTASSRFVLIEEGMGQKNRKITFKVVNLKNWVGVGVCLKDKISAINYAFKYESLGHGSFLLSNNGYTWSHSSSEDNIHSCLFTFKQDNTVEVTLSPNDISFKVNDNPNPFKLKIEYKQQEWPNVCFCANLCSHDDAIEILDV